MRRQLFPATTAAYVTATSLSIGLISAAYHLSSAGSSAFSIAPMVLFGAAWTVALASRMPHDEFRAVALIASITGPAVGVLVSKPFITVGCAAVLAVAMSPQRRFRRILSYLLALTLVVISLLQPGNDLSISLSNFLSGDDHLTSLVISQTEPLLQWRWPFYLWGLAAGLLVSAAAVLGIREAIHVPVAATATIVAAVTLSPTGTNHAPASLPLLYTLCLLIPLRPVKAWMHGRGVALAAISLLLLTFTASQLQYFWYEPLGTRLISAVGTLCYVSSTLGTLRLSKDPQRDN